ncbi:hypothetical protein WMF27_32755 [Sorangium sp. So ce281]|uniref:hypothetical protein n=1 Tax=unclassified Sorangium TaxID=2621164 RepID=UPI003F600DA8
MLRLALEAARRDAPDKAQLARLAARLPLHPPGGPGGGKDPGGPADGGGPATGGGAGAPATGGGAGAPATHAPEGIAATGAIAPPSVLSGLAVGALSRPDRGGCWWGDGSFGSGTMDIVSIDVAEVVVRLSGTDTHDIDANGEYTAARCP